MADKAVLDIAVAGGGVAGIVAAHLLGKRHKVTLYEKNDYIGGHTRTVAVPEEDGPTVCVDTGFIVFNDRTYPNFIRFIEQLGVERQESPMSFTYWNRQTGFLYNTTNPFADRKNILNPSFWRLLLEIDRFNRKTRRLLAQNRLRGMTLGHYLKTSGFSGALASFYVAPICAAIWSAGERSMLAFPAETFGRFFENHGLLSYFNQPRWFTVRGGSREYVKAFLKTFSGTVRPNCPVRKIRRDTDRVRLWTDSGEAAHDKVVIAAHADEALAMIADPSDAEHRLLSPWRYAKNRVVLHRDTSFLPLPDAARGAWNYTRGEGEGYPEIATLTYYMNRLQQLKTAGHYCVSLNPEHFPAKDLLISDHRFDHPLYSEAAIATQKDLGALNGVNNTWFCGSYFRYGFHEDAVMSAAAVGEDFGVGL